jgi:hypothetical protein
MKKPRMPKTKKVSVKTGMKRPRISVGKRGKKSVKRGLY